MCGASEKALVRLWAGHGRGFKDIPIGWLISGDESFDQTSCFYPYYTHILSCFSHWRRYKAQFSDMQIDWNRKDARRGGIVKEVVFATLVAWVRPCNITITLSIHYLWVWAHGMANMDF
eukprot:scaffold16745_cov90-Skeletonema_dohrnii-CCMP3373.AAC.3